jgi:hypothetical protein
MGNSSAIGGRTMKQLQWTMGWQQHNGRHNRRQTIASGRGDKDGSNAWLLDWPVSCEIRSGWARQKKNLNTNVYIHRKYILLCRQNKFA